MLAKDKADFTTGACRLGIRDSLAVRLPQPLLDIDRGFFAAKDMFTGGHADSIDLLIGL